MSVETKRKRRWRANGAVHAGTYIGVVEADTEEEAKQLAFDMADVGVCHQCSHSISDPEVEEVFLEEITDEEEL